MGRAGQKSGHGGVKALAKRLAKRFRRRRHALQKKGYGPGTDDTGLTPRQRRKTNNFWSKPRINGVAAHTLRRNAARDRREAAKKR